MPILRFGVFEVDTDSGELRKRGFKLRLREQPLRVLLTLVDHAGQVVTREQLRHRLWPDGTFVDFGRAINKAVSELRGVLGDSACSPRFVETVSPYDLAIAFTGIGDHDSALDYLEEAFAQRVMRIVGLGDPEFDGLRAEPRYRHLFDRLRLPSVPL